MSENRVTNWYCGKCGGKIYPYGNEHICKEALSGFFIQIDEIDEKAAQLEELLAEMEEHRQRYTDENAKDGNDYWRGRRDEAGYFRDKLKVILEKP